MAASTVTSPARLNQAVVQPQPRPPRMVAQWYRPPAVGYREASCPMVAATAMEKQTMSGQPTPMAAPPTLESASGNEVAPPARIPMIDREMA